MKESNEIWLGFAVFVFAGICFFVSTIIGKPNLFLISLGLNGLNLFWIIDLQKKIYKKKQT